MRAVIQRVAKASVDVDLNEIASIGSGLLILLGIESGDTAEDIEWLAGKISRMRIFSDADGKMNLSVLDLNKSEALVISQFTLHASTRKGNRPSFIRAAEPCISEPLYEQFCHELSSILNSSVKRGVFGADMKVKLVNDGPVTIIIDSNLRE